jgi:hypothetical protein
MTFQVPRPHPAGQCFGPKCSAAAREKDRGLIPRFCSDPCKERFVDEHHVFINAATSGVRIHPDLDGAVVRSDVVPVGQAIVAAKPEKFVLKAEPPKFERRSSFERDAAVLRTVLRWRGIVTATTPAIQELGRALQDVARAIAPVVELFNRITTRRSGPPPLPFNGHAYRNRTRRRTRRNR